ncbi:endonuclease/exonuclease/phosphatase family protein [Blastococcus saxobsidens]|uniref:Endonuclease/exonuclease/phosphatase family protein n=1 Tax=Blastococcus saxobsidens TaxID=138336 RepID=A0A4Q7Y6Z5_9ACTN|nr:endonuclease/exonuclease/phosphatase family protein [Blastococcus saxobsidens]RZU32468.1 endonuclease/exonuclease/phosphatase family protein [Blastococcus saxobsidens]
MSHPRPARRRAAAGAALAGVLTLPVLLAAPAAAAPQEPVTFSSFNVSMFRATEGELAADLADADDEAQDVEVRNVAEIIQRQRPDVLLLNEFDYDAGGLALERFQENFLAVGQGGAAAIDYPYALAFPSNTGIASGYDLDHDGEVGTSGRDYGDDSFGFGEFPGQYGFVLLSQYPIDTDAVRTFQEFRWADMPGARLPDDPGTPEPADWYSAEELEVFRLSSKNHVDVPVEIGGRTVHVLASHPTPPSFDGPEDRNGTRNADEIRFWADYVSPGEQSGYIYDDAGVHGGLRPGEPFVIMGDLNADPADDGGGVDGAARQVTDHPFVRDPLPASEGAAEASALQGGANEAHAGDPAYDTADFNDNGVGNLRVDYVLPSRPLRVLDAGVFWPAESDPLSRLTGTYDRQYTNGFPSSDHRLVWVDVAVPGAR